jgi:hypothetical protein
VSICTKCGRDHDATGGVCTATAPGDGRNLQSSQKTLYGFVAPPVPSPTAPPAPPSVSSRAPTPAAPSLPRPPGGKALAATLLAAPARLPPPSPSPPRLPTAEEARQNPNLVISLEATPPPSKPALATPVLATPPAPAIGGAEFEAPVDLPEVKLALDRSAVPATAAVGPGEATPTDLPPPGSGPRFALPEPPPPAEHAAGGEGVRAEASFGERLAADVKSVIGLLGWSSTFYLGRPQIFFLLAAFLVLPASMLQSCLVTSLTSPTPTISVSAATVDFSARKAELAARIQDSQTHGQFDKQAAAELAALTAAETVHLPLPKVTVDEGPGWFRMRLALFVQGLLVFGLAFPLACVALAIALYDRESGAAYPGLADLWPIAVARGELLLVSLLPAAVLVAVGNALFVLPGLVLSVLFLFVPHVVVFEKRGGREALARSIELARIDVVRSVLVFLAFALAGAVVAALTELLLPTTGTRAVAFLHFIACDLLAVAILPIPALVLARLYLDLRRRAGANAERLARAARA